MRYSWLLIAAALATATGCDHSSGSNCACDLSMAGGGGAGDDLACSGASCAPPVDMACSGGACTPQGDLATSCGPMSCGNTCTDDKNCGTCGHDCQGGACTDGICQGAQTAMMQGAPYDVAVDATNIYWTDWNNGNGMNNNGEVMTVPIAGGTPAPIAMSLLQPRQILLAGGTLYWATFNGGELWKVSPPTTGTAASFVSEPAEMLVFAVDSTNAYMIEANSTVIRKVALTGGTSTPLTTPQTGVTPGWLVTDGAFVYWTNTADGTIYKTPVAGGSNTMVTTSSHHPGILKLLGSDLYFTTSIDIEKVAIAGGTPVPVVSGIPTTVTALAVDSDGVYWTHQTLGSVWRSSFSDGVPRRIGNGQNSPQGITSDATSIYWANFGMPAMANGTIMRAVK